MSKPRQVRVQLTGGIGDVERFFERIQEIAEEEGFVLTFKDGPKRFGDFGPLHKTQFGFTTSK
jgi:hypothetical protein